MANDLDGRLIARVREPGRMSDLYSDLTAPAVYADGITNAAIGSAISRLSLFRVFNVVESDTPGIEEQIEKRLVNLELTIPTAQLISFAAGIVAAAIQNQDLLKAPHANLIDGVEKAIATIQEAASKAK